jgi:hypothetical protein
LKYGRRIKIEGVYDFSLLDYKFFDGNNDEIRL